jgi:hypothetical protein
MFFLHNSTTSPIAVCTKVKGAIANSDGEVPLDNIGDKEQNILNFRVFNYD